MTNEQKLEYNKLIAKFLNIKVEEYGYKQWDFKLLGILDENDEFKQAIDGTTLVFDASNDWNILIKCKYLLLKHKKFSSELWKEKSMGSKINMAICTDKPEFAFKTLAEFIKENNL